MKDPTRLTPFSLVVFFPLESLNVLSVVQIADDSCDPVQLMELLLRIVGPFLQCAMFFSF